jgi:hypothetical protein
MDEFNTKQNKNAWDELHKHIASVLTANHIPLDNVFFVNTPGFLVFLSENDNSIIQRPASDYSEFLTRKVIFEKCKQPKKFDCFFHRNRVANDKIVSKPLSVMSYRLNWNESSYGSDYDLMKSLRTFIKTKSHLPIFMYVDASFFDTIQETKIIRVATLDTTAITF